jgi:hypothetical protein
MISPPKREAPQRRGHQQPSNGVSDGLLSCRVPAASGVGSLKIRVTLECLESEVAPFGGPSVFKTKDKVSIKTSIEGFDPGSERTLAAWIRHASRARKSSDE